MEFTSQLIGQWIDEGRYNGDVLSTHLAAKINDLLQLHDHVKAIRYLLSTGCGKALGKNVEQDLWNDLADAQGRCQHPLVDVDNKCQVCQCVLRKES